MLSGMREHLVQDNEVIQSARMRVICSDCRIEPNLPLSTLSTIGCTSRGTNSGSAMLKKSNHCYHLTDNGWVVGMEQWFQVEAEMDLPSTHRNLSFTNLGPSRTWEMP